jgi:GDP-L-fucose synthase
MNKTDKIYIAGHNGMVGSAIMRKLEAEGFRNIITKDISELDLTDQKACADFFAAVQPAYVILAAAKVGGIVANNTYRAEFIYTNTQIQNNVIHQSYLNGVKKLLFLGSSCIYPRKCPQPMREEHLLTGELEYTNEPYAIAKISGIKMCESYNLQYGTNFIAVMPTNLYGPNDNYDLEKSHVLPALVRKMHLGKALMEGHMDMIRRDFDQNPVEGTNGQASESEITEKLNKYGIHGQTGKVSIALWGSGKPRREFLHADDLAAACTYLMEHTDFVDITEEQFAYRPNPGEGPGKEIRNTHINIGTGKDLSIRELAMMIKEITGYQGNIRWDSKKPDGTDQKLLDVGKMEQLGWRAEIRLKEGIEKVYKAYKK